MSLSKNSCSSAFRFPDKKISCPPTAGGFYAEHKSEHHASGHHLHSCDSRPKTQSRRHRAAVELQSQAYLIIHGDHNRRPSSTQSPVSYSNSRSTQRPSTERLRIRPLSQMTLSDEISLTGEVDNYVPPSLISKYTALIPRPDPVVPRNNCDASTETTPPALPKREITGITDYNKWVKETVDPFVSSLKSSILSAKPDNIAEYVSQYGVAVSTQRNLPRTMTKLEWEAEEGGGP